MREKNKNELKFHKNDVRTGQRRKKKEKSKNEQKKGKNEKKAKKRKKAKKAEKYRLKDCRFDHCLIIHIRNISHLRAKVKLFREKIILFR